ncbi:PAS domain S-box-containing protein [Burkholderia sp. WP9]|nr:PAS domain S-box-containing protein [Burkholderia sp. WP9]
MLHLPLIRYVEVRETQIPNPLKVYRGSIQVKDAVVREFPIYCCENDRHQIGVLHIEGSLTDIYRDLLREALVILVSNAAKTFLVALFILFMVHRLATRHLVDIAATLRGRAPGVAMAPLRLRRIQEKSDELDQLVNALNVMFEGLEQHSTQLRNANAQMAAILDNIPDLAWVKDTHGRYVAVNRALARTLGYAEPSDVIGRTDFDLHPLEHAKAYRADDVEVMVSGQRKRIEEAHVQAGGHWSWVDTIKTSFADGHGLLAGTVGIARDVTERKKVEEDLARAIAGLRSEIERRTTVEVRLQASEARFRAIVETSPVPLCIVSMPQGEILYTSEPLRALFGLNARDGMIRNIAELYVDTAERDRLVEHLRQEASFRDTVVHFRRPDGSTFWAMVAARVATYEDAPAIYIGLNDITERKRIELELFESREQLREVSGYMEEIREQERKRIAMEIHDELGQLLTALKMDVSLLKMRLSGDMEAAKKADDMRELVEKTIWMVRNVANHLRPAALNFGIVSALEWLAKDFSQRNGIPCRLRINGPEPVLSDTQATVVFRIVQASLTNVARHADATRVDVTLTRSASALDLHISDDGRGFNQEAIKKGYSYGLLGMRERARLIVPCILIAHPVWVHRSPFTFGSRGSEALGPPAQLVQE